LLLSADASSASETAADAFVGPVRSFLMLNDKAIEFVDGAPVLGYWRTVHRWDAKNLKDIEVVDGIEFPMGRPFWRMVEENDAKYSAASDVRIGTEGRLFYRGKPVELGFAVGRLSYVMRWRDWIVAEGTSADETRATLKGPIAYLFWFGTTSLKGSYRELDFVEKGPLRIYSK
jgi:hypothetical protein